VLGILLAVDEGLLEVLPGSDPTTAISGHRFTSVDYADGIGLAAAPGEGVWVNSGSAWAQLWDGDPETVRVSPQRHLFIGTHDGRLFASEDQGLSWQELEGLINVYRHNKFIAPAGWERPFLAGVAFTKEGLLVGIGGGGVWHTRDRGGSWLRRGDGLDPKLHRLRAHPEVRDRVFASTDSGVYRSEDEGFSWVQSLGGLDRSWGGDIAIMPGSPDALLLAVARHAPGEEGALFRSANGGVTWARVMLGDEDEWDRIPAVTRLWDSEDTAFVAAGERLWASHDSGRHWMPLGEGLPPANAIASAL
jgi:photosystem II stability/assembly factor-like uncharacterized protein